MDDKMSSDKMFRCAVLTPSTGSCKMGYTISLYRMLVFCTTYQVYEGVEQQFIDFDTIEGSGISSAREALVDKWLKKGVTHVLFIDEDMEWHPRCLHMLVERNKDIVGANYSIRAQGQGFTALRPDKKGRIITYENSTGIEECFYTGFGFCLIKTDVFRRVTRPWFLIGYNTVTNRYTTEDAAFAHKLHNETDVKWYVDHDVTKLMKHIGDRRYTYHDALEASSDVMIDPDSTCFSRPLIGDNE